jgi:hypothetical protein
MSSVTLHLPTDTVSILTSNIGIEIVCVPSYSRCRRTVINHEAEVSSRRADEAKISNERDEQGPKLDRIVGSEPLNVSRDSM